MSHAIKSAAKIESMLQDNVRPVVAYAARQLLTTTGLATSRRMLGNMALANVIRDAGKDFERIAATIRKARRMNHKRTAAALMTIAEAYPGVVAQLIREQRARTRRAAMVAQYSQESRP